MTENRSPDYLARLLAKRIAQHVDDQQASPGWAYIPGVGLVAPGEGADHASLTDVTSDQHHAQSHVLATGSALGPYHTMSGAVAGDVLRALSATTADFAQLSHTDLGGVTSDQHHAQLHEAAHAGAGADAITSLGAVTFTGNVTIGGHTLDLTGSTVSGAPTWSSNQAITLSTAAQPNITSVGTLTNLQVTSLGVGVAADGTAGDIIANAKIGIAMTPVNVLDIAMAGGSYPTVAASVGTAHAAWHVSNTGGSLYAGLDNSAGTNFNTGVAYSGALWRSGANPIGFVTNGTQQMQITGAGAINFPSISTTVSAANAFVDSASSPKYNLLQSTSSRRYKTAIRDLGLREARLALRLRARTYRSLASADDHRRRFAGLVAEEVARIAPNLVTYDAKHRPDGVMYAHLVPHLLTLIRDQERRIAALEA